LGSFCTFGERGFNCRGGPKIDARKICNPSISLGRALRA
jgi:hypothetical protein